MKYKLSSTKFKDIFNADPTFTARDPFSRPWPKPTPWEYVDLKYETTSSTFIAKAIQNPKIKKKWTDLLIDKLGSSYTGKVPMKLSQLRRSLESFNCDWVQTRYLNIAEDSLYHYWDTFYPLFKAGEAEIYFYDTLSSMIVLKYFILAEVSIIATCFILRNIYYAPMIWH